MAKTSVVAGLSQRVAIFGVLSISAGLMLAQTGLLPPMAGFGAFAAGAVIGGLGAFVLGAVGLFATRAGDDPVGRRSAIQGLAGGLALVAILFFAASTGGDAPPINDITTNLEDPPMFATGTDAPDYGGRDMSYPSDFVAIVREHYPDLKPIESDLAPADAFAKAVAAAESAGLFVTYTNPDEGRFDAQERTAVFRFVDDVTFRVRASGDGSVIDVRSKSRDGRGDLGANARRIERFEEQFEG